MKFVLMPGMDGSGELFSDFLAELPDEFAAATVRYPCESNLSYHELTDWIKQYFPDGDTYIIIAESFSVPVAIKYAARNPRNLKALILCAGFATSPIKSFRSFIGRIIAPVLLQIPVPDTAIKHWLWGQKSNAAAFLKVKNIVKAMPKPILIGRIKSVLACDVRLELEKIQIPILYIQAKQDQLIGKSCFEEIRISNPAAKIAMLDGPHLILQYAPREAAKLVMRFIDDTARQA